MKKSLIFTLFLVAVWYVLLSCATLTVTPENYRATILYFEGGNGEPKNGNDWLINRISRKLVQNGIEVTQMQVLRNPKPQNASFWASDANFRAIQARVDKLKEADNNRKIWLMGISNGGMSVAYAGFKQVNNVEGLIFVNPVSGIYSPFKRSGVFFDLKEIRLPLLMLTHQNDICDFRGMPPIYFANVFASSPMAEIFTFQGGQIAEVTWANAQKYQHGLRGHEDQVTAKVIEFIDRNQLVTKSIE